MRTLSSADGLEEYLLSGLDLNLGDCWVTDLVKVFLYKPDHVESCKAVHPDFEVPERRREFLELARKSLRWLREEIDLCQPKLVVTLGEEVAKVVSGDASASADDLLQREIEKPESLGGHPTLYCPHPDACRRFEKWRERMPARVAIAGANL